MQSQDSQKWCKCCKLSNTSLTGNVPHTSNSSHLFTRWLFSKTDFSVGNGIVHKTLNLDAAQQHNISCSNSKGHTLISYLLSLMKMHS